MVSERVRALIASELEIPLDVVPANASAETLEAWDSLGHMKVIMSIEQEFGVRFQTGEIPMLNSVEKLSAALKERGAH